MNQDVLDLIQDYFLEMTIVDALLETFREKYHYLEAVEFNSLDDIAKFACFMDVELGGVHLIQFLGLSACRCRCQRDCFLWIFTNAIVTSRPVTMSDVLSFIEESGMVCEHELVSGFLVGEDIIHVLVKRESNEVNGRVREEAPSAETQSERKDNHDVCK
jgi:hypothetical protein